MATSDTPETEVVEQEEPVEALSHERTAIYIMAAGAIVGAFLPWYTVFGATVFGVEGDGLISLLAGLATLGIIWYVDSQKRAMLSAIVGGALISLIALFHVTGVSDIGVYVTLFAGIGLIGAGISGWRKL